ncbi:hypothetical protein FOA52_011511 [Chlamydomonas sp. UWO 241]|nr:hypothetical protein FOA52_011511 [Chlamydomonas sp. UWO 241]
MSLPALHYFPLRGRGEVIRLLLHVAGVEHDEHPMDYAAMKADLAAYPFGQCPRYVDADVDLVQSNTIMRYLAAKHGLMGSNAKQAAAIDMVMEGVESLRNKYLNLVYADRLSDEAKATYWTTHLDPSTLSARNGGAHMGYLARLIKVSPTGWTAGTPELNAGDLQLFDILDLHSRIFAEQMKAQYPELMAYHDKIAEIPSVKAYLEGPRRQPQVNGIAGLG